MVSMCCIISDSKSVLSYWFSVLHNLQLQNAETGLAAPMDQSSHLLTGSKVNGKENEKFVATCGATLTQPTLMKLRNDLKVWVSC